MSQSNDPDSSSHPKMSTETGFVTLDSAQLFTKTWLPATAPIALLLFIHGFTEYIERYDHVFSHFAQQGIKTFAWDQRGFGRSAPRKSDWGATGGTDKALEDIDYFVKQIVQEGQQKNLPVFIWGHSMGGGLALMYAANGPEKDKLRGVISQAPLIKLVKPPARPIFFLASIGSKLFPNLKIYSPVPGAHVSRHSECAKKYDEDPLVHGTGTLLGLYTMLARGEDLLQNPPIITMPLLVQHGTDDKVTSCDATHEFFEKLPEECNADRELKMFEGYYHELHNEPEDDRIQAIKYISDWILKRCDGATATRARL